MTEITLTGWEYRENRDFRKIIGWLNDKKLMRFSEQRHHEHTMASQMKYVKSINPPSRYMMVCADGELVGTVTARVDPHNMVADLGILIGVPGKGYGKAAWSRLIGLMFDSGIRKVTAGAMACNTGMVMICGKAGMNVYGVSRDYFIVDGKKTNLVLWDKFR